MRSKQIPSKKDKKYLRSRVKNSLINLDKFLSELVIIKTGEVDNPKKKVTTLKFAKKTILDEAKKWSGHVKRSIDKDIKKYSRKH